MRHIWLTIGLVAFAAGIAGLILPLVPATVFMIIAAWAFGKSSPRMQRWLLTNRHIGPPVTDWRDHGMIRRKAKAAASAGLLTSLAVALFVRVPGQVVLVQALILAAVAVFIWTRPETPS